MKQITNQFIKESKKEKKLYDWLYALIFCSQYFIYLPAIDRTEKIIVLEIKLNNIRINKENW